MTVFKVTSHLSHILEESEKEPIIIFKYSNNCGTSNTLKKSLEKEDLRYPVFLVTVQILPVLSSKIEEVFGIKHETPQIIVVDKGKVIYTNHHHHIKIKNIVKI